MTSPCLLWPGTGRGTYVNCTRCADGGDGRRSWPAKLAQEIQTADVEDDSGDLQAGSLAGIGLARLEKEAIRQTLALTKGNREQTAKLLFGRKDAVSQIEGIRPALSDPAYLGMR